MSAAATVLVLLSAFLHAGWNIFSKRHSPTAGFFALASWGTVCCFSPVLFWTTDILSLLWSVLWWKLLLAGFFQAVYYLGLAGAYQRGALSIAYPLARAFPLCILVILASITGQGSSFSLAGLAGLGCIFLGAIVLPMDSFKDFRLANYRNASCAFALLAAFGTAGYSFVDDNIMGIIKTLPGTSPVLLFSPALRRTLQQEFRILLKPALQAGQAIGMTYGLVLLAMTQAENVSYVVGLRQLSIPIGTFLGIVILKEMAALPRYLGAAMLFCGLVLVILG